MYRIEPEYMIAGYLAAQSEPVDESTLMNALNAINLHLLRKDISTGVGFRKDTQGQIWSPQIASALKRLIVANVVRCIDGYDGVTFSISDLSKGVGLEMMVDHEEIYPDGTKTLKGIIGQL